MKIPLWRRQHSKRKTQAVWSRFPAENIPNMVLKANASKAHFMSFFQPAQFWAPRAPHGAQGRLPEDLFRFERDSGGVPAFVLQRRHTKSRKQKPSRERSVYARATDDNSSRSKAGWHTHTQTLTYTHAPKTAIEATRGGGVERSPLENADKIEHWL